MKACDLDDGVLGIDNSSLDVTKSQNDAHSGQRTMQTDREWCESVCWHPQLCIWNVTFAFAGCPCNKKGECLPDGTMPAPRDEPDEDFALYDSREAFELADLLY